MRKDPIIAGWADRMRELLQERAAVPHDELVYVAERIQAACRTVELRALTRDLKLREAA